MFCNTNIVVTVCDIEIEVQFCSKIGQRVKALFFTALSFVKCFFFICNLHNERLQASLFHVNCSFLCPLTN